MDLQRLYAILDETTMQMRKGAEREERMVGNLRVVDIYLMPPLSDPIGEGLEKVDVFFVVIGVNREKAEKHKAELIELLKAYPNPDELAGGPSYINVGHAIGSQDEAMRLFGLGKVLGLWEVVTPDKMGFEGEAARDMAGAGLVMITGFKP